MSNPKKESKERVVLDTSIWFVACASKQTGDKTSEMDLQYKEVGRAGNPDQLRGVLIDALVNKRVIVPEAVLRELKNNLTEALTEKTPAGKRPKFNDDNIHNLQALCASLENRTTKIETTREAVALQHDVWAEIQYKGQSDPTTQRAWVKKFEPHWDDVKAALKKSEGVQLEPWIHAKHRIEELRVANIKAPSKHIRKEIQQLQKLAAETEPSLVPDFEILLTAIACKAPVLSRDVDFSTMWAALPDGIRGNHPESIPVVRNHINDTMGKPATMAKLAEPISGKVHPFRFPTGKNPDDIF